MAETTNTIKHSEHIILEQLFAHLPYEVLRNNLHTAHLATEKDTTSIKNSLRELTNSVQKNGASRETVVQNLDAMIQQAESLRSKLVTSAQHEEHWIQQQEARIQHAHDLYQIERYDDPKYERWNQIRTDRLAVDYLVRNGYERSAESLAKERGIENLVDTNVLKQAQAIARSLRNGNLHEALAWGLENKKELRKINSPLLFKIRKLQFGDLIRSNNFPKAIQHFRKSILPFQDDFSEEIEQLCGLVGFPGPIDSFRKESLFHPYQLETLANLFLEAFYSLLGLSQTPLLHLMLSSGLSALKTPACHPLPAEDVTTSSSESLAPSATEARDDEDVLMTDASEALSRTSSSSSASSSENLHPEEVTSHDHDHDHDHDNDNGNDNDNENDAIAKKKDQNSIPGGRETSETSMTLVCPVCSEELNDLARPVPYANHTRSHLDHDLLFLPNHRAHSEAKLVEHARQYGLDPTVSVRDPRTGEIFDRSLLRKVYIS